MNYQANRHTDALIAAKVLRLAPCPDVPGTFYPPRALANLSPIPSPPRRYSTDIGAAWQVVEDLIGAGYQVGVFITPVAQRSSGMWTCAIADGNGGAKAAAETAPLAICRAALSLTGDRGSS